MDIVSSIDYLTNIGDNLIMKKISLNGEIGWDLTPQLVADKLAEAGGQDVEISLYSGGGDVFDGFEIYNILNNYEGSITMILGSLVASAATYAPLAADKVIAQDITNFMIHDVSSMAYGSGEEIAKEADKINKLQNLIASKYAEVMNKSVEEVNELMHAETWFTGQEIVDAGFAHELLKTGKANNSLDFYKRKVKNLYKNRKKEKDVLTKQEILDGLKNQKKEIKFSELVDIFEAKNLVKSDEDVRRINDYENLSNKVDEQEKTIAAKDKEIADLKMGAELDSIFGAKDEDKNLARNRAEELYLSNHSIEEIKKDAIMKNLMAQKAAGFNIVDNENNNKEEGLNPKEYV